MPHRGIETATVDTISLVVTFSYPLQSHPSRACILSLVDLAERNCLHKAPYSSAPRPAGAGGDGATTGRGGGKLRFYAVTTGFVIASSAIALSTDDLGIVLSLVGATGSTIVSFILPGATYFFICHADGAKRYLGLLQLLVGCILMPLSLSLIIIKKLQ